VTGNHEYYWGVEDWLAKVKELGFVSLLNENRVLKKGGGRLLLAGIPDQMGEEFVADHYVDIEKAADGGKDCHCRVLLSHRPTPHPQHFDLQLSGHTHGGQFFPFNLLVMMVHKYYKGLYQLGESWLYVSCGTGYWGPAQRFGIPSEITVLRLRTLAA